MKISSFFVHQLLCLKLFFFFLGGTYDELCMFEYINKLDNQSIRCWVDIEIHFTREKNSREKTTRGWWPAYLTYNCYARYGKTCGEFVIWQGWPSLESSCGKLKIKFLFFTVRSTYQIISLPTRCSLEYYSFGICGIRWFYTIVEKTIP